MLVRIPSEVVVSDNGEVIDEHVTCDSGASAAEMSSTDNREVTVETAAAHGDTGRVFSSASSLRHPLFELAEAVA